MFPARASTAGSMKAACRRCASAQRVRLFAFRRRARTVALRRRRCRMSPPSQSTPQESRSGPQLAAGVPQRTRPTPRSPRRERSARSDLQRPTHPEARSFWRYMTSPATVSGDPFDALDRVERRVLSKATSGRRLHRPGRFLRLDHESEAGASVISAVARELVTADGRTMSIADREHARRVYVDGGECRRHDVG